jgi:hypothetical protein
MCPDIALPVPALAAYSAEPSEGHPADLLHIARCVDTTASWGIIYGDKRQPLGFWCNANLKRARTHGGALQVGLSPCMQQPSHGAARSRPPRSLNDHVPYREMAQLIFRERCEVLIPSAWGACLVVCGFLWVGLVTVGCDNQAALSLCKVRTGGAAHSLLSR